MADMEETGQQTTGIEEDPAAAFLAREQDELADIAGDTLGFQTGDSVVSKGPGSWSVYIWHILVLPTRHSHTDWAGPCTGHW